MVSGNASEFASYNEKEIILKVNEDKTGIELEACNSMIDALCLVENGEATNEDIAFDDETFTEGNDKRKKGCDSLK